MYCSPLNFGIDCGITKIIIENNGKLMNNFILTCLNKYFCTLSTCVCSFCKYNRSLLRCGRNNGNQICYRLHILYLLNLEKYLFKRITSRNVNINGCVIYCFAAKSRTINHSVSKQVCLPEAQIGSF